LVDLLDRLCHLAGSDKGAPHGLCTTHKDEVSADLLAFAERKETRKAA
jgi:hypothetical protein